MARKKRAAAAVVTEDKAEDKQLDAGELAAQEQAAVQKALDDGEAAREKAPKAAEA